MLTQAMIRLKDRTFHLHFANTQIVKWCQSYVTAHAREFPIRILDVGLGTARDLLSIRAACGGAKLDLHGIECQERHIEHARTVGIATHTIDIEKEPLPFDDQSLDIVLSNHVIEHLKELYWFFGEISRVLKPGGMAVIGCPNLASWHNRVALLFGNEPPCMKLLGPHVRGVTKPGFKRMIEFGGFFKLADYSGSNFYPLPSGPNKLMASLLPTLCASHHFVLRRTEKSGNFLEVLDMAIPGISDTPYHRGRPAEAQHKMAYAVTTNGFAPNGFAASGRFSDSIIPSEKI
jgi:SAM-dependent methyltransferase